MKIAISEEREAYRERLYQHYLENHRGVDIDLARKGLQGAAPYLRRLISRHLPEDRNAKIVDLGCGYGALLYWLRQAGYRNLEGVDRSPEQVQGAHALGLDFVQQADIMAYLESRQHESCDVVIAFDVLEHLSKYEALSFADQVFRVLQRGGLFLLHTPNGEGIFSATAYGDFTHELILTPGSAGQLLRSAGFCNVSSYEDVPVVHGIVSAMRFVIWKIFKSLMRIAYAAETGNASGDLILTQNFLIVATK